MICVPCAHHAALTAPYTCAVVDVLKTLGVHALMFLLLNGIIGCCSVVLRG